MPATDTDFCATATYVTFVTKIQLAACAIVASSAFHSDVLVTLGTMLVAIGTQFSTVFATSAKTNDSTVRTQKTFDAEVFLAAGALHANTAVFTHLFVTFVAMLSALFANQSAVFTMVTRSANYSAIRT